MEIRYNNVKYNGKASPDDTHHEIVIPQTRGRGEYTQLVKIKKDDMQDIYIATDKDECISLIGIARKGTSPDKITFALIREEEPNPAKTEPDPIPDS